MSDDAKRPLTGAERQRAYRQRNKSPRAAPRIEKGPVLEKAAVLAAPPELPEIDQDADDEATLGRLNAYMRQSFYGAFHNLGGQRFLERVGRKSPATFLRFGQQFVTRDETSRPQLHITVKQIVIEGAQPVRGVLSSPVLEHVSEALAPLLAPPGGEVIDG